ncbi:LysR substrate-binding domain-containing protein [Actinomadura physcomitrii]|uniref:LysR substrate-binding domain-containing protein n=1 Tax=Actinomadura physcomitrii TaxID=2650748 RepID=UPI002E274D01
MTGTDTIAESPGSRPSAVWKRRASATHLNWACGRAGFVPRIAFATDDHVAVRRLVAHGLAVTALPGLALGLHREPGAVVPPAPDLGKRRIAALVPAGPRPPAVAALLDELAATASAAPSGTAGDAAGEAVRPGGGAGR